VVSGRRYLQGSREGRAIGVICFLAPAHVGFVAFPGLAVLPDGNVSGCSVLQPRSVREDRQPWSVGPLGLIRRRLRFLDGGGCVQRGDYLEEDRFLSAVPASQMGLESLAECAAPMSSLAWSPFARLARRRAKRRRRLSSWVVAGLSPDSKLRAPWLVVLKAPRVDRASWFTSFWMSSCRPMVPWTPLPFHQSSDLNKAAAWTHLAAVFRREADLSCEPPV